MDKDIFSRLALHDEKAFELLFKKYYSTLCNFATKFVHDRDLAEDIVQEIFYKLWRNPHNLDSNQNIASYLFRAVQNQGLNILDRKQIEKKYKEVILNANPISDNVSLYEQLCGNELEIKIQELVKNKLPDACRKVFELSRSKGLKNREIAEELNISIKTVETQISRALVVLRFQLKEYITVIISLILLNL